MLWRKTCVLCLNTSLPHPQIALLTAPDMSPEAVKALEESTSATSTEATEGIRQVRLFKEVSVAMTAELGAHRLLLPDRSQFQTSYLTRTYLVNRLLTS